MVQACANRTSSDLRNIQGYLHKNLLVHHHRTDSTATHSPLQRAAQRGVSTKSIKQAIPVQFLMQYLRLFILCTHSIYDMLCTVYSYCYLYANVCVCVCSIGGCIWICIHCVCLRCCKSHFVLLNLFKRKLFIARSTELHDCRNASATAPYDCLPRPRPRPHTDTHTFGNR